jgi:hypothetical protein
MTHQLWGVSLVLSGLLWAGCVSQDDSLSVNNASGTNHDGAQCRVDTDCAGGQVCERGVCAAQPDRARAFSFVFLPPPSSGYLPQRLDGLQLYPGDPLNFLLESSVQVDGDVSALDRVSGNVRVLTSGTLLFERAGDGDATLMRQVRLTDPHFEVKVRPGTYTITYLPLDDSQLGWRWERQEIQAHATLALTMPEQEKTAIRVDGKLVHRDPLLGGSGAAVGVAGVRVSAIGRSGLSSNVAVTNEAGEFRLLVWPDSGSYDLHIWPAEPNSLAPRAVLPGAFVAGREPVTLDAELGVYPNPARAINVRLSLAPQTLDALDSAPGELVITLRAGLERGELVVSRRLGEDGAVELPLLPMRYTLTIKPPVTSRVGAVSLPLDLGVASLELPVAELPMRRRIAGTLITASGQPAKRAKILVYDAAQANVRGALEEPATFVTDEDGRFEVWIDRGAATRWALVPESGQQAPRGSYALEAGEADIEALQLALPAPSMLSGSVRGEELEAQPDVAIQVFETLDKVERLVAEGTTDARGKFKLWVTF